MLFSWEKPERHIFHCTFHQNKPESKFETSFQLFQFSLPFRTFIYRICLSACVVHSHYDNLVTVCLVLDFLSYLWLWLCHDRLKPPERFRFGTSVLFEIYFLYRDWEIDHQISSTSCWGKITHYILSIFFYFHPSLWIKCDIMSCRKAIVLASLNPQGLLTLVARQRCQWPYTVLLNLSHDSVWLLWCVVWATSWK